MWNMSKLATRWRVNFWQTFQPQVQSRFFRATCYFVSLKIHLDMLREAIPQLFYSLSLKWSRFSQLSKPYNRQQNTFSQSTDESVEFNIFACDNVWSYNRCVWPYKLINFIFVLMYCASQSVKIQRKEAKNEIVKKITSVYRLFWSSYISLILSFYNLFWITYTKTSSEKRSYTNQAAEQSSVPKNKVNFLVLKTWKSF